MRSWLLTLVWLLCAAAGGAELRRYEVRPGDTLYQIARRELGDAERWRDIARLNGMQEEALREGEIILLPAVAPAAASPAAALPVAPAPEPLRTMRTAPPAHEATLLSATGGGWDFLLPTAAVFAALWALFALSLRIACWFALVESSLTRCALLALALSFLAVAALAVVSAVDDELLSGGALSGRSLLRLSGMLAIWLFLGAALARWLLSCRWRSVITVYAMSLLVAGALAIASWQGLIAAEAGGMVSSTWRACLRQLPQAVRTESRKAMTACSMARSGRRE